MPSPALSCSIASRRRLALAGERLQSRLCLDPGPSEEARAAVADQIERVLRDAVHGGIHDATMLDYFYLVERLRRWGTTGERGGVVSPLLVPAFVRGAFSLNPRQRVGDALHTELVRRLVPEWADVPFFKPDPTRRAAAATPRPVRRLADAADRERIAELVRDSSFDGFAPASTARLWSASAAGTSTAVQEAALGQWLWQASFEQHLAELNHINDVQPSPLVIKKVRAPSSPRARRIARNRAVRALARQPVWQAFRRTSVGRSWRSLSRPARTGPGRS